MAKTEPSEPSLREAATVLASLQREEVGDGILWRANMWRRESEENRQAWDEAQDLWDALGQARDEESFAALRAQALAATGSRPSATRRWMPVALAASLAGIVGIGLLGWQLTRDRPVALAIAPSAPLAASTYATDTGQRKVLRLSDGSVVTLGGDTEIRVAMSDRSRDIRLVRGRAFFAVRSDKQRPFVVDAGALKAVAVGTAFDVNRAARRADVTTTEGLVQVEPVVAGRRAAPILVPAGTKLSLRGEQVDLARIDAGQETAWTQGRLIFRGQCLRDVAEEMNRFSRLALYVDPGAENLAVSGVFRTGNSDGFARALEEQGIVQIHGDAQGLRLSPAADKGRSAEACGESCTVACDGA